MQIATQKRQVSCNAMYSIESHDAWEQQVASISGVENETRLKTA
jgi:hypothetical protein